MKQNLNYLLYGIALVLILIPIALEQMGNQAGQPASTILLSCGALFLVLGKLWSVRKKRKEGASGASVFQDAVIIVCLLAMMVWMIVKG